MEKKDSENIAHNFFAWNCFISMFVLSLFMFRNLSWTVYQFVKFSFMIFGPSIIIIE